ncbi:MAG: universal stress protein [Chloroflexota bacterium]
MTSRDGIRKILIPLDGSEPAESIVNYVGGLAKRLGAGVHLLGVVVPPDPDLPADLCGSETTASAAQYLHAVSEKLEASGVRVTEESVEGLPSVEIIKRADDGNCDLIALATRGRSASGPNLLGITTDRVLRSPSIPVLVVPPEDDEGGSAPPGGSDVSAIIVGLDGSEVAAAAVKPAKKLAKALGVKMILVRVAEPVSTLGGAAKYYGLVDDHARHYLQRVADEITRDGVEVQHDVRAGRAQRELTRCADEHPGSLMVLSTHGWSRRGDWALGSTTDRIIRAATHPVLVVHPEHRSRGS